MSEMGFIKSHEESKESSAGTVGNLTVSIAMMATVQKCLFLTGLPAYITLGASTPITPSALINSRRTTPAVASRNFFRASSSSLKIGYR